MFSITYHRPNPHASAILPGIFQTSDPHITEWVTPGNWSSDDARKSFEARHPGCVVLRCDQISGPYGNLT
jgi:hypothetical protein